MKRLFLFVFAALAFAACEQAPIEEQSSAGKLGYDAPDTIYASLDDDATRTYVEQGKYLRWHAGDEISFFPMAYNMQYQFQGETGDNNGAFKKLTTDLITGNELNNNYAVYPYKESTAMSDEGVILFELPAEQGYAEDSFGLGANTMVAITSGKDDNILRFKNACGYLKLNLYGEDVCVKSIMFKGNNDEKIAGAATITAIYGNDPVVAMNEEATTTITLDCGDGAALGTTEETATAFWFVIPVTTFEEGFTVTVTDTEGGVFEKSTSSSLTIERNHIQPMKALEVECVPVEVKPASNEIWYTNGSTTEATAPYFTNAFGANIVSNTYDAVKKCWVIKFDHDVTMIGEYAFYKCSKLTSVTIPDSVISIERSAFHNCSSLNNITIHDNITNIGFSAFQGCALSSVIIPENVTVIEALAFANCWSLKSVTIPDSITLIGDSAFNSCTSLASVTIPDSVTTIGQHAFMRCSSLASVTIGNGVTKIETQAFYGCSSLTSVTMHGSVTTIGTSVFGECHSLPVIDGIKYAGAYLVEAVNKTITSCTILDGTRLIGENAFKDCNSLTRIIVPYSVTLIGDGAFQGCAGELVMNGKIIETDSDYTYSSDDWYYGAKFTKLTIGDNITRIGNNAFFKFSSLTSVNIGDSVTTIGNYAFNNCSSLTSVTIPDSVTTIGDNAFWNCSSLVNVTIGDSVTTIGEGGFAGCSSITNVALPDSLTMIGGDAFNGCTSLRSITIPANVKTIEAAAFYGCKNLASVYCKATTPPVAKYDFEKWGAFNNTAALIYVPKKSVTAYQKASGWSEYQWYIEGYNF